MAQATLTQIHRGFRNAYWYRNDNRNQQHYFPWPSVQRRFSLDKPLGWGDLAGAGNLAEIVEACVCRAGHTDPTLTWNLDAYQELAEEIVLHAVILTAGAQSAVVTLLESLLGASDLFTMVIVGPVREEVRRKAPKGVFFVGHPASVRPILAAAQVIVLPAFDEATGQAMFGDFVTAAGYGRPMLVGSGLDAASQRFDVKLDLAGLSRCEQPGDFWPALRHLIEVPDARRRTAAISAGIGDQLRAAGILKGSSAASPPDLIWGQDVKIINETLRACLEGEPAAGAKITALAQMLQTSSDSRAKAEALLRALFVDKDAPILGSVRYPFVMLRQLRPVGSAAAALALCYAAADKVRFAGTAVMPSHRLNGMRFEISGTPLDGWRRGETPSDAAEPERRPGPPRIVVLVCPEHDDRDEFRRLAKEVLEPVVADIGAELFSNVALQFVRGAGPVQTRSISAPADITTTGADLVLCVGSAAARLSPESFRLGAAAMRSGLPVLGNPAIFWYLGEFRPSFVCDENRLLLAKVGELLADPVARDENLAEVSRSFFADDPWIAVERERAVGDLPDSVEKDRLATEYPQELFRKALARLFSGQPIAPTDVRRLSFLLSDSGELPAALLSALSPKDCSGIDREVAGEPTYLDIIGENLRAIIQPLDVEYSTPTVIVSPAITIEGLDRRGAVIGRRDGTAAAIARRSWLLRRQDLRSAARVRLTLRGLEDEVTGDLPIGLRGFYQWERIGTAPPFRWTGPDHESEIILPIALTSAARLEITIADLGLNRKKPDLTVLHDEAPVKYDFVLEGDRRALLRAVLEPKKTVNGTVVLGIVVGKCHRSGETDRRRGVAIETLQLTMDFPRSGSASQGENWLLRATDWVKPRKQLMRRLIANGNRARDQRDWKAAAVWYRKALEADPQRPAIWVQLGHALKEQGDRAGGEEAYRRSLELADNVADTHLQIGHVLKLQGRIPEAAQAYFKALLLEDDFAYARMELAGLGYSQSEIEGALSTGVLQPTMKTATRWSHETPPI